MGSKPAAVHIKPDELQAKSSERPSWMVLSRGGSHASFAIGTHTFGTRLGESGADAFTIMKLMGHGTITVSQKYVHPSTDAMKAAIREMSEYGVPKDSTKVVQIKERALAASS